MSAKRPPIVLLFFDQLRADALSCSDNPFARTPNLDQLAASAVRFSGCVTNAPLCRPARFTLMTGLPVHLHGQSTNARPPSGRGLQSHVREVRDGAGYHTAVVGKTHLHGGQGHLDAHRERLHEWGFREIYELPDAQQHWVTSAHSDWLSASTPPGEVDKHRRLCDYIDRYAWDSPPPDKPPWRLSFEDHLDTFCAATASRLVRSYGRSAPLYLQVNFPGPHPPFDAPSELLERFDPEDVAMLPPLLQEGTGPVSPVHERYLRQQRPPSGGWTERAARLVRARYHAKVALVDRCAGMVFDALREVGLYDRAWIIATADHGELLADHQIMGKVLPYEGSVRIPLVIRPPGGTEGRTEAGAVDLLDVVATIRDISSLPAAGTGGRSLAVYVSGEGRGCPGKDILLEAMGYAGLRSGPLTFAWDLDLGAPVELYDRSVDPDEMHNLVERPERAGQIRALGERLRELRGLGAVWSRKGRALDVKV